VSGSPRIPLILGDGRAEVHRIGWALDAGEKELAAAAERRLDLLLLWTPLWSARPDTLRSDTPGHGRVVEQLIRAHCAVALVGPALANSAAGPDLLLASELGLTALRPLFKRLPVPSDRLKLVIFTPVGCENVVIEALAQEGAGVIGRYSHCTFRSSGIGTYRPLEGAQPWAGTVGRLESAEEMRLETVVPREKAAQVLDRVRAVHPYEEMAYDLYPLEDLREAPPLLGWMGEMDGEWDAGVLKRAGERCLGSVPVFKMDGILADNPGSDRLSGLFAGRMAVCLNGVTIGDTEARRVVQAGCGWVVCGALTEEARLVLAGRGVRIAQFEGETLQKAVFCRLLDDSAWGDACIGKGVGIERV